METKPTQTNPPQAVTACGGKLRDPTGYPYEEWQGQRVYFCNEACRLAFLGDPARFMAGEIEHPKG